VLHRELAAARFIPRISLSARTLRLIRKAAAPAVRVPAGLVVDDLPIEGPGGALRLRLYRPTGLAGRRPALLWFHGGGYVIGRPEQDDRLCLELARRLQLSVASVDYRLAPEHPFPAALDDGHTALHWLIAHSTDLQLDPSRIAVGGNSAGGGLAAALAQRVHDEGQVQLALQLLVYPMLDDHTEAAGPGADLRIWTPASNRFGWTSYLGAPSDPRRSHRYAVPARRDNLSGLAPAWIGVGSEDLFFEEDAAYAGRLSAAGVACELVTVPGAFHGFDAVFPRTNVSRGFLDQQIAALAKAFHPETERGPAAAQRE
jgi:acetyl esterase/lipase